MTTRPAPRRLATVAAAVLAAAGAGGCASSPHRAALGYGTLPAFLPRATVPVDRVVTASAGHPRLAVQGVGVEVDLPGGHVLATVTGPQVPPFVAPPPPAVTATFQITLARASGAVPVRPSDFTITDQLGRTFVPTLVTGEAVPPAAVPAGGTVGFRLNAVLPTGEGRIHWAPGGGPAVASWDFIVEND